MENIFDLSKYREFSLSDFYWLEYETNISFGALKQSIKNNEELIQTSIDELEERVQKDKIIASNEPEEYKGRHYIDSYQYDEESILELRLILRDSSVLSAFSIFEGKLKKIASITESLCNSKLKVKDLKSDGNDFKKILKFLTLVYEADISKLDVEIQEINKRILIRNKIAHLNRKIHKNDLPKISGVEHIKVKERPEFSDNYVIEIIDVRFLEDLVKKLEHCLIEILHCVNTRYEKINTKG